MLSKAGAAAIAAVAAGTFLSPRQAEAHVPTDGNIEADMVLAHKIEVDTHGGSHAIFARTNTNFAAAAAVMGSTTAPRQG